MLSEVIFPQAGFFAVDGKVRFPTVVVASCQLLVTGLSYWLSFDP